MPGTERIFSGDSRSCRREGVGRMTLYQTFIQDYPVYAGDPLIQKAFAVAEKAHEGQLRNSGEPYIVHPYEVTRILAELGLDNVSICFWH